MNTRTNSLQAALAGAAEEKPKKPVNKKSTAGQGRGAKTSPAQKTVVKPAAAKEKKTSTGGSRDNTVMVGAHFPPHVSRQLRVIAAEDGTTNQALIGEALDLLFTRKGKSKISDLSAG